MPVEITPEPTPDEREALLHALGDSEVGTGPPPWWQAGIREAVEGEPEET